MAGASTSSAAPPRRLSTAAQFFDEENENQNETQNEDAPLLKKSTYDKVVDLLNQASLLPTDSDKVGHLKQVQELIVHKDPALLDNFLDEVIAFQNDRSADVKKCIIGFMEEACKKDHASLLRVVPSITHLLQCDNVNVQKKIVLAFCSLYSCALQWIGSVRTVTPAMAAIWEQVNTIKTGLQEQLQSDNDGVRTHVVKMLEGLTLTLSKKTPDSEIPKNQKQEFSLDQMIENNRLIRLKKLEVDGQNLFTLLVQFQGSLHISSINLMTVMGALANIARQRPGFFDQVVQSFEALHVNLPPTLAKSQVSSVRKNLKMHMMALLKHNCSVDFIPQITTLLTDLGASQSEINKAMPKDAESRKRKLEESSTSSKKAKIEALTDLEADDYDIGMTPWADRSKKPPTALQRQTAIDITAEDILPRLSVQHVADLVLLSMVMLPDQMPAQFQSTYTPIAAAGTESQIRHISRLLATQLTMAGMGKGIGELKLQAMKRSELPDPSATPAYEEPGATPKQSIQTVVGGSTTGVVEEDSFKKAVDFITPAMPAPRKGGVRQFKLETVTKPLKSDTLDSMSTLVFSRVLHCDKLAAASHVQEARIKILVSLTAQFGGQLRDMLEEYIFSDLRNRWDMAFSWLYQEYVYCQGFNTTPIPGKVVDVSSYDECLTRLLKTISEMPDQKDGLFHRLILQAPLITGNAMQMIRRFCSVPERAETGMKTLRDLIMVRPKNRLDFLDLMLTFTSSDRPEVRNPAIQTAQKLYENVQLRPSIEVYAVKQLKMLLTEKPETDVKKGPEEVKTGWTEDSIKTQLYLYLGLLPHNHALIHELANIYTATSADVKRTILRVLEGPVKGMGMDSPELLTLVENCPKGSETLVMRVIHILTDKANPSKELVDRIRDLYHKRVPDVRFLIPVLNGLSKKEVINALPKLIKLNPMVVKEVFNRLMGAHISANAAYQSPLTPDDLLVALHNIDPNKCDMKTIIKAANLCFSERSIYTQEVLAIVMQRLMELSPLPTLLMRTVIQSLSMYPRLVGFVLNILKRLIIKEVWNQKKVWEGFIKCCQRTKPQSFQVLLQLPAVQMADVFQVSPDLRLPLLHHVRSFSQHQLACLPPEIMLVLETEPVLQKTDDNMDSALSIEKSEITPPGLPSTTQEQLPPVMAIQTISTYSKGRNRETLRPIPTDVQITGGTLYIKQEPASPPPPPPSFVVIKQERDDDDYRSYESALRLKSRPSSRDDSRSSSSRRLEDADRSKGDRSSDSGRSKYSEDSDRERRSDDANRSRRPDDRERPSSTSKYSDSERSSSRRLDDADRARRSDDKDSVSGRSRDRDSVSRRSSVDRSSRRGDDDRSASKDRSSARRSDGAEKSSSGRSDRRLDSDRESIDKSSSQPLLKRIKLEPMEVVDPLPSTTEPILITEESNASDQQSLKTPTGDQKRTDGDKMASVTDPSENDQGPEENKDTGKGRSSTKVSATRRSTRSKR